MNVITIMSDEHSWSAMGCSGSPLVKTPNLDRLAAMSVNFKNAYTLAPYVLRRGQAGLPGSMSTGSVPGTTPHPMMGLSGGCPNF